MSGFLGSGNVYGNQLVAGAFLGFVDLGNCTEFSLTEKGDQKIRESRRRGTAGQALSTVTRKKPTEFGITWDEQGNVDNVALSTHGTLSDMSQSALATQSATVILVLDKWVEIASGVRNVSNVTIATLTEGTDYDVLPRLGLIRALTAGAVGSKTVGYDRGMRSGSLIVGSTTPVIRMHFVLDGINDDGEEPVIVDVWDAVIQSASSLDPLSDNFATGKMSGILNTPDGSLAALPARTGPYHIEMKIVDG